MIQIGINTLRTRSELSKELVASHGITDFAMEIMTADQPTWQDTSSWIHSLKRIVHTTPIIPQQSQLSFALAATSTARGSRLSWKPWLIHPAAPAAAVPMTALACHR